MNAVTDRSLVLGLWKTRREFEKCFQDLNGCKIAYEENLEELLLPLVADEGDIQIMLANPRKQLFHDS